MGIRTTTQVLYLIRSETREETWGETISVTMKSLKLHLI